MSDQYEFVLSSAGYPFARQRVTLNAEILDLPLRIRLEVDEELTVPSPTKILLHPASEITLDIRRK